MKENKMYNKCVFCGNKNLTEKNVQYIYKHNSNMIIVNDVPSLVCDYCGEQYFKGEVLENIEKLFFEIQKDVRKVQNKIEVPVEEYANISNNIQ